MKAEPHVLNYGRNWKTKWHWAESPPQLKELPHFRLGSATLFAACRIAFIGGPRTSARARRSAC